LKELFSPGRNDPCPCGSGLKYKRCCQRTVQECRATLRDGAGPEAAAAMPRLLGVVALACGLKPAGGARAVLDGKRLAQNLQAVVVGLFDPAGVLAEAAAGDFPFFEAAAQRELAGAAEAATDGDLRRAVEALRDGLDLADAPGFAVIYHLFYVGVILQMLAEGNIRVPRRGGPPVPVPVFSLRSEHLADYAAYLEEQGEGAAAARVREVAPLFGEEASDADPSD